MLQPVELLYIDWDVDRHEVGNMQGTRPSKWIDLGEWLTVLSVPAKITLMVFADVTMTTVALALAITLHVGGANAIFEAGAFPFFITVGTALISFARLGLYRVVVRHIGLRGLKAIAAGATLSALAVLGGDLLGDMRWFPMAVIASYWAFALLFVAGSRQLARHLFQGSGRENRVRDRVVIYGAGEAGISLLSMLRAGRQFVPVGFVDDKRVLQFRSINGISVFPAEQLPALILERRVQRVLLALPTASRRRRQEIMQNLEKLGVRVQSVPDLADIVSGRAKIDEFRDVDVADLLGRDPVPPIESLFRSCIADKSVMVTGAGGSIGSELCRQILQLRPRRLVLFELSEYALYAIEKELRETMSREGIQVDLLPLLGSVRHQKRVRDVMFSCEVQTVYHAAAYKHVPLVEHNMIEGLHNNVIGTWYTAEAALDAGVDTFVLVSTDKAVNPANVMGATKRFSELVLQGLQRRGAKTNFSMVRFGNVLDSSGSVVPLFREQIRRGGPVTVTHPDVTRYFMTIPEAAQLVIQAGAMGKGGDVFVLDMGQPVRIDSLARRMIGMMGYTVRDDLHPEGDIEIRYTGLRTAEKLYEELLIGSNVTGTEHPRILRAVEHSLPWESLQLLLDELLSALANYDCKRALQQLTEAVAEYEPDVEISDYIWRRSMSVARLGDGKVTLLARRRSADASQHHD